MKVTLVTLLLHVGMPPSSSFKTPQNSAEPYQFNLSPSGSDDFSLSPFVRDESSLSFEWTGPRSLRVTNRAGDEDDVKLRPTPKMGNVQLECLFTGYLAKDLGSSAGVVGCQDSQESSIVILSKYSAGTMFSLFNNNKTTIELKEHSVDDDHEEELNRTKRSMYYEDDDYVYEYDYNSYAGAIPLNVYYSFSLGFDESILKHFGGNKTAAKEYITIVATLAQTYFKSDSLGTRIHFDVKDNIKYIKGKEFKINPNEPGVKSSLSDAQNIKTSEPLIIFTKTDDTELFRGVARIRGACDATLGRAIVKHREQYQRAALTMAHELGHLFGKLHDSQEDARNKRKPLPEITNCKGQGIMTDSVVNRPSAWSTCSSERLIKWYTNYGYQCLKTAPACDNTAFSGPCSCGVGADTNLCTSQEGGYCHLMVWFGLVTGTCMVKETEMKTCHSFTSTPGDLLESGCEQPQDVENGFFVCVNEGLTCHINCDPGFKLATSSPYRYIECINGSWTQMPSAFRCIPDCDYTRKSHPDCKEDEVALIVGGQFTKRKVELWSPSGKCNRELKEFPFDGDGMTTNYVNGAILSCGGESVDHVKKCYSLNVKTEEWEFHSTMLRPRRVHSSVVINGTILYIIGGIEAQTSIEFLEPGTTTWKLGPPLPVKNFMCYGTCSIQSSADTFVVHGGGYKPRLSGNEYSFITQQWTTFGNQEEAMRMYHGCSLIKTKSVFGIIIAGGYYNNAGTTSFFLNLNEDSPAWKKSSNMNFDHTDGKIVKLNNRHFILGGEKSTKVEEYHPENGTWTSVPVDILYTRNYMYGITAVPSKLFSNCN